MQYAGSTGNQGWLFDELEDLDDPDDPEDAPDDDFAPADPDAPVPPDGCWLASFDITSVRVTVVLRRPPRTSTVVSTVTTLLLDTPFLVTECVSVDVEVVVDDPVSSVGSSVTSTVFLGATADVATGVVLVVEGGVTGASAFFALAIATLALPSALAFDLGLFSLACKTMQSLPCLQVPLA